MVSDALMTYLGFRIWYADGSARRGLSDADWLAAPSTGVQAVAIYMQETYPIWLQDSYDEHGRPVNQRRVRERYRDFSQGVDYYWLSVARGLWGASNLTSDIPLRVPAEATKTGSLILDDVAFRTLAHSAYETKTWSGIEEAAP